MELKDVTLSEISQRRECRYESTYLGYQEQADSQRQEVGESLPGAGGGGNGDLLFNGHRVLCLG